jgi:hypothetical protein
MNYTKGFSMVRKGLKAYHPAEVYDAAGQDGALAVHVSTRMLKALPHPATAVVLAPFDAWHNRGWLERNTVLGG